MARDLTEQVREFVVEAISTAAPAASVAASVEPPLLATSNYGPAVPENPPWPFTHADLPVVAPDYEPGGCSDNTRYTFRVHGFAKGVDERNAARLGAALASVLDELSGVLDAVPEAVITDTVWTGTQVFRDTASNDGWHAVVSVYCLVSG